MKKSIIMLFLLSLMVETGCKSNTEKEVEDGVTEALHEASQDKIINEQIVENNNAEWNHFKSTTASKIKANEALISDLRLEIKQSNKKYDDAYLKNITLIEKRNADLLFKINNYNENEADWKNFKIAFNRDMDELGKSLDNLNIDNEE